MGLIPESNRIQNITLTATEAKLFQIPVVNIKGINYESNVIQIRNFNDTDYIYLGYDSNVASDNYIRAIPPLGVQVHLLERNVKSIYLVSASNCTGRLNSYYDPAPNVTDLDNTNNITILNQSLTVSDVGITSIAAGDNNIGNVDVVTLPAIPAGSNTIGKVDLNTGSNTIGNVGLNTGTNSIGKVTLGGSDAGEIDQPSNTATIYNTAMATANTEYNQALPTNTKKFEIKLRSNNGAVTWQLKLGASGNYISLLGNQSYFVDNIYFVSQTLYFQADTASQVAEIIAYRTV